MGRDRHHFRIRVAGCRLRFSSGRWPLRGLDLYQPTFDAWGVIPCIWGLWMMQVAARLVDEFGEGGRRCVEFLETASVLLCGGFRSVPRWGQTVAYCLREAMTAIPEAAHSGSAGRWKEVSRNVVDAGTEYRRVQDSGPERDRLLGVLLARIDDLGEVPPRGGTSAATAERCDGQPYGCCADLCSCLACRCLSGVVCSTQRHRPQPGWWSRRGGPVV